MTAKLPCPECVTWKRVRGVLLKRETAIGLESEIAHAEVQRLRATIAAALADLYDDPPGSGALGAIVTLRGGLECPEARELLERAERVRDHDGGAT